MYRHGLVHLYQPKILIYKNGTLEWFLYKGKRHHDELSINNGSIIAKNVDHLKVIQFAPDKKKYHLSICINALYDDFEQAVMQYRNRLKKINRLQSNWRTAVNAICEPQ